MAKKGGNPQNLVRDGSPGHDGSKAGRKPDWLKAKCAKLFEDDKLAEFWSAVARGDLVDERFNPDTRTYDPCRAPIKARIEAADRLADRGFGKAVQPVGDKDDGLQSLTDTLNKRYGA